MQGKRIVKPYLGDSIECKIGTSGKVKTYNCEFLSQVPGESKLLGVFTKLSVPKHLKVVTSSLVTIPNSGSRELLVCDVVNGPGLSCYSPKEAGENMDQYLIGESYEKMELPITVPTDFESMRKEISEIESLFDRE